MSKREIKYPNTVWLFEGGQCYVHELPGGTLAKIFDSRPGVARADVTSVRILEGAPATYRIGSDTYPMTVSRVSPSRYTVWAKRCRTLRSTGTGENRHGVLFEDNDDAPEQKFCWSAKRQGYYAPRGHGQLSIGRRASHMDPSF